MAANTFFLRLVIFCAFFIFLCNCRLQKHRHKHGFNRKFKTKEFRKNQVDISRFTAPQLSHKEKLYLAKIEDALTSKKGRLIFTNSWAVQLNPAEVASVDQIAKRNGFHNMGQVISLNIELYDIDKYHYSKIVLLLLY